MMGTVGSSFVFHFTPSAVFLHTLHESTTMNPSQGHTVAVCILFYVNRKVPDTAGSLQALTENQGTAGLFHPICSRIQRSLSLVCEHRLSRRVSSFYRTETPRTANTHHKCSR